LCLPCPRPRGPGVVPLGGGSRPPRRGGGGGGGIPYSGLYREALPEGGAFFKARSILKGRENCHFSTL